MKITTIGRHSLLYALFYLFNTSILAQTDPGLQIRDQQILSDNPTRAEFINYSTNDYVDKYTGMVNVRFPLETITQQELSIPIELYYHNSGQRVRDMASWVGLGWNVTIPGSIRREVRGIPDNFHPGGFFENLQYGRINPPYYDNVNNHELLQYLKDGNLPRPDYIPSIDQSKKDCEFYVENKIVKSFQQKNIPQGPGYVPDWYNHWDSEPDVFHYQLPGVQGSFYLGAGGVPVIINGPVDVKIVPAVLSQDIKSSWVITLPNGDSYIFPHNYTVEKTIPEEDFAYQFDSDYVDYGEFSTSRFFSNPARFYFKTTDDRSLAKYEQRSSEGWYGIPSKPLKIRPTETMHFNTWYVSKVVSGQNPQNVIEFKYQSGGKIKDYSVMETTFDYLDDYYVNLVKQTNVCDLPKAVDQRTDAPTAQSGWKPYIAGESDAGGTGRGGSGKSFAPTLNTIYPIYLKEIKFDNGSLVFNLTNTNRQDLTETQALESIKLYDGYGTLIRSHNFEFDYSSSCSSPDCKRMLLTGFSTKGTGSEKQQFEFEYNDQFLLPSRTTTNRIDYWGFFNDNEDNTSIPSSAGYPTHFSSGDRIPYLARAKAGMLEKVIYPTGGATSFEYELNDYESYWISGATRAFSETRTAGGLRVSRVTTSPQDDLTPALTVDYLYTDGDKSSGRVVNFVDNWPKYFQDKVLVDVPHNVNTNERDIFVYLRRTANPLHQIYRTKGGVVGYGKVTRVENGNGRTEYVYTNPESHPDLESQKIVSATRQTVTRGNEADFRHSSRDELRGLLLSISDYNEAGVLLSKKENTYSDAITTSVLSLNLRPIYTTDWAFGARYAPDVAHDINNDYLEFYEEEGYFPILLSSSETSIENGISVLTKTDIDYHDEYPSLVSSRKVTYPDGTEDRIFYRYPGDVLGSLTNITEQNSSNEVYGLYRLQKVGRIGVPFETIGFRKRAADGTEKIIGANFDAYHVSWSFPSIPGFDVDDEIEDAQLKYKYALESGTPLLESEYDFSAIQLNGQGVYELVTDDHLKLVTTFEDYSQKRNIKSIYYDRSGLYEQFIWGYEQQYPIAKIVSSTQFDIGNIIPQANLDLLHQGYRLVYNPSLQLNEKVPISNSEFRSLLQPLTHNPSIRTEYFTFQPLIGITSATESNGKSIFYEYDSMHRLLYTKDHDGNIVTQNEYKYKQSSN